MRVETSEYKASHGKAPRGRGGWAFCFRTERAQAWEDCWFSHGSYSEAKAAAVAEAKRRGSSGVKVLP